MTLVADVATLPDLLRLLAVPVLGWAAYRDVKTRRVPNRTWLPLAALGVVALALEAHAVFGGPAFRRPYFLQAVALSLGLVVPAAYLLWRIGGFGGADAKALMVIALLFPTYPTYYLSAEALPLVRSAAGVFSLTILTNAVLAGAVYPLGLAARNALAGRVGARAFVGLPVRWDRITRRHGRLLETPSGFTRGGLDLDALRMYLRWRGLSLAELRSDPGLRDPATLPDDPDPPTDGAVHRDAPAALAAGGERDAGTVPGEAGADGQVSDSALTVDDVEGRGRTAEFDDPWGAAAFLAAVDGTYGTTPEQLRDGLDLLAERETVWISPGIPFLVPVFVGVAVALVYGDVMVALLVALGLA